eukprot:gene3294-2276_t
MLLVHVMLTVYVVCRLCLRALTGARLMFALGLIFSVGYLRLLCFGCDFRFRIYRIDCDGVNLLFCGKLDDIFVCLYTSDISSVLEFAYTDFKIDKLRCKCVIVLFYVVDRSGSLISAGL